MSKILTVAEWEASVAEAWSKAIESGLRETVAEWMIERGYATGHGDTVEDLLKELEWQIREREREACAKACEENLRDEYLRQARPIQEEVMLLAAIADCAAAIRARRESK